MSPELPVYLEIGDRYELHGDRYEVIDIVPPERGLYKYRTYIVTRPDVPISSDRSTLFKHGFGPEVGGPIPKIEIEEVDR